MHKSDPFSELFSDVIETDQFVYQLKQTIKDKLDIDETKDVRLRDKQVETYLSY